MPTIINHPHQDVSRKTVSQAQAEQSFQESDKSDDDHPQDSLQVTTIAKKYGLVSTYETLEGHQQLPRKKLLSLLKYSYQLARDQGGCRFLQKYIMKSKEEKDEEIFDHIFK